MTFKRLLRALEILLVMSITAGLAGCGGAAAAPRKTEFPDNAFKEIPQEYYKRTENGGMVVSVKYTTKNYMGDKEEFEKTALVYLPYGYNAEDTDKKYNVMYMMHGGGGSEKELLGGVMEDTEMKLVLDNMIANGDMEPCIFVGCSYNNPFNGDATACCENFYMEFVNDLIPAVEGEYNTYCEKTSSKGIKESRLHRGFGGFSMGSACTWWIFENALEEVGYFLPVSGDSWCVQPTGGASVPKETAEYMRQIVLDYGMTKDDFIIYCGTGTNDIAYPNMNPMIDEMEKLDDVFVFCDNFKDGNIFYAIRDGGWHDQNTVRALVYNGLPKFFG